LRKQLCASHATSAEQREQSYVPRKSNPMKSEQRLSIDDAPDVLTVKETAALLRVDRKTIYSLINSEKLHAMRAGTKFIVPKLALKRLLGLVS